MTQEKPKKYSCSYCGKMYIPGYVHPFNHRPALHNCPLAMAPRRVAHRQRSKERSAQIRLEEKASRKLCRQDEVAAATTGKYVCKKTKWSEAEYIAPGTKLYLCRSQVSKNCFVQSVNRFHCPACLAILEHRDVSRFVEHFPDHILGHEVPQGWYDLACIE